DPEPAVREPLVVADRGGAGQLRSSLPERLDRLAVISLLQLADSARRGAAPFVEGPGPSGPDQENRRDSPHGRPRRGTARSASRRSPATAANHGNRSSYARMLRPLTSSPPPERIASARRSAAAPLPSPRSYLPPPRRARSRSSCSLSRVTTGFPSCSRRCPVTVPVESTIGITSPCGVPIPMAKSLAPAWRAAPIPASGFPDRFSPSVTSTTARGLWPGRRSNFPASET